MRRGRNRLVIVAALLMVATAVGALLSSAAPAAAIEDQPGVDQACKIYPECWVDSDCDARCGVGLGKCIHNRCPVRICRCG